MDISELDDLENSVQDLLSLAKIELEEKRLQLQRDEQVELEITRIKTRLEPLLAQIEEMLSKLTTEDFVDSVTKQKLEAKSADLRQRLEDAPLMAAQTIDRQMILNEERLLDERVAEQTNRWRQGLKADLLEMISEQTDFYSATDTSIAIRVHIHDLKAIGSLEEVVDALIHQINDHSEEGPVARLRGSHEQTLSFIYNKALENRARVDRAPDVQPRVRHRSTEKRPNPYGQLEGKVVIFGGHDRLETSVRNRLREANVNLVWCTAQAGPQLAEQAESHINKADLILVVTGYTSHKLTDKAMQAAQRAGKAVEMVNTTGVVRVLEAIEYGLKSQQLARQLNNGNGHFSK
jgi:vacuolar-type H+-ATPase subunit I/STV1